MEREEAQEKAYEAVAVAECFILGVCDSCGYRAQCEEEVAFEFPQDAPCTKRKKEYMGGN